MAAEYHARLGRAWRLAMGAWARRWKTIWRDRQQADAAGHYLSQAIRCREKSKQL